MAKVKKLNKDKVLIVKEIPNELLTLYKQIGWELVEENKKEETIKNSKPKNNKNLEILDNE